MFRSSGVQIPSVVNPVREENNLKNLIIRRILNGVKLAVHVPPSQLRQQMVRYAERVRLDRVRRIPASRCGHKSAVGHIEVFEIPCAAISVEDGIVTVVAKTDRKSTRL